MIKVEDQIAKIRKLFLQNSKQTQCPGYSNLHTSVYEARNRHLSCLFRWISRISVSSTESSLSARICARKERKIEADRTTNERKWVGSWRELKSIRDEWPKTRRRQREHIARNCEVCLKPEENSGPIPVPLAFLLSNDNAWPPPRPPSILIFLHGSGSSWLEHWSKSWSSRFETISRNFVSTLDAIVPDVPGKFLIGYVIRIRDGFGIVWEDEIILWLVKTKISSIY